MSCIRDEKNWTELQLISASCAAYPSGNAIQAMPGMHIQIFGREEEDQ